MAKGKVTRKTTKQSLYIDAGCKFLARYGENKDLIRDVREMMMLCRESYAVERLRSFAAHIEKLPVGSVE